MQKKKKHYVDNKLFSDALIQHKINVELYKSICECFQVSKPLFFINNSRFFWFNLNLYMYYIYMLTHPPIVSDYIVSCFYKIADGFAKRPLYTHRTYRDDLISNAVENCLKYITNYNPEKSSNPFSYFSQIIYYNFLRTILDQNKQRDIESMIIEREEYDKFFHSDGLDDNLYQSLKESLEIRNRKK